MVKLKPDNVMLDRNGHELKYGDGVLVKMLYRSIVEFGQVIGFNKSKVLVLITGSTDVACRKPSNVVYIKDLENFRKK